MRKVFFAITILCLFVNMRCEPNDEVLRDSDNLLIGHWSDPEYSDQNITFKRVNSLPEDIFITLFTGIGNCSLLVLFVNTVHFLSICITC